VVAFGMEEGAAGRFHCFPIRLLRGWGRGSGGLDGVRAVQQRLAALPLGHTAGLTGRRPRGPPSTPRTATTRQL